VSIFLKSQWQDWAREWGLTHYPEKGWSIRNEHVVGKRNGSLVRAGWAPDRNGILLVTIRYPKTTDLDRLRDALINDASLDTLPGKGKARKKTAIERGPRKVVRLGGFPEFTLTDGALIWRRPFPWSAPKAAKVQAWTDALVTAVSRSAPAFDGHCETCGTGTTTDFMLLDDVPVWMCRSCVQRLKSEAEMAERTYDMSEARHLPGALLATVAALVGAAGWAALGAGTERTFAAAAIGIGALVAYAYRKGAGRVDAMGRGIAAILSVGSVVLGEMSLYAWWFAQRRPDLGFNLEAGWFIYLDSWKESAGQEIVTLLFGLVGAWTAASVLKRPKLAASVQSADPNEEIKKAA